jgi:hypothetical protein
MTPEELAMFQHASNHPYKCTCMICTEWWRNVPLEEEDELTEDNWEENR